jgi:hypothetical protein
MSVDLMEFWKFGISWINHIAQQQHRRLLPLPSHLLMLDNTQV